MDQEVDVRQLNLLGGIKGVLEKERNMKPETSTLNNLEHNASEQERALEEKSKEIGKTSTIRQKHKKEKSNLPQKGQRPVDNGEEFVRKRESTRRKIYGSPSWQDTIDMFISWNQTNMNGAVTWAATSGYLSVVEYLLRKTNSEVMRVTAMNSAAEAGHLDIVKFSVEGNKNKTENEAAAEINSLFWGISYMDANEKNHYQGFPALHLAAKRGHLEMVRYLVTASGCPRGVLDEEGWTLLHTAAQWDQTEVLRYLICECKVPPEVQCFESGTALHVAAHYGSLNVVMYLVEECHIHPVVEDKGSITPLQACIREGHTEVMNFLVGVTGARGRSNVVSNFQESARVTRCDTHSKANIHRKANNIPKNNKNSRNTVNDRSPSREVTENVRQYKRVFVNRTCNFDGKYRFLDEHSDESSHNNKLDLDKSCKNTCNSDHARMTSHRNTTIVRKKGDTSDIMLVGMLYLWMRSRSGEK
ncbi:alpha-latrotoxin-Lt1a-like [Anabrus simplex]|uniref:alpha-latrotoxin-Lt1a-like n=1 Tax=Anabrus simplex TaxID=316456 RepID=UPI0035A3C526